MRNEVSYQKIRAYLLGELTPVQVKDIEDLMASDPEFAAEVELHRTLIPALEHLNEHSLRANFDKWKAELADEKKTRRDARLRWLCIASGLVIILLGLLHLVFRKPAGTSATDRIQPSDTLQQMPAIRPYDTLRKSNQEPPVAGAPIKNQTLSNDQTRITAARQLAQEQIAGLIPAIPTIRGQKPDNNWKTAVREVDSLIAQQHYAQASQLLNASPGIPKTHQLLRQVYLYQKHNRNQAAIKTYQMYMETVGDPDEAGWGLALVYLAAYPAHQSDFWKQIDTIRAMPGHKYRMDTEKLVNKLNNAGIVR